MRGGGEVGGGGGSEREEGKIEEGKEEEEGTWAWAKELDINFSSSQIFCKILPFPFSSSSTNFFYQLIIGMVAN